jgi:diguanylate cyclase (GGDEF)-like protein/PAS domain S-box-containing protein
VAEQNDMRFRRSFDVLEVAGGDALPPHPEQAAPGTIVLPNAPALISSGDGAVARVSEQMRELVGAETADCLVGKSVDELFDGAGPVRLLNTPDGELAVRLVSWRHPGTELLIHLVVDAEDEAAVASGAGGPAEPDEERELLVEAQRMARIGSFVFDPTADVLYRSPVLGELFADGQGDLTLDHLEDFIAAVHPDDRADVKTFYADLMEAADGRQAGLGVRNVRGDRVYLCIARAEPGPDGIPRLVGTVQDVTTQRQLEHQLREERRRLRDLQRVARLGTWETDPATGETLLSETLCEIVGWNQRRTRTTYDEFLQQVPAEDRELVDEVWRRLRVDREPIEFEHRFVRPDGAVRLLRMHAAEVYDLGGHSLTVGTVQDVTDQRAASTRLQRFTDLCRVAPVGIGLFDESELLLDANDALCDLLGYRLDEISGVSAADLTHPQDQAGRLVPAPASRVSHSPPRRIPQRRLIRSDGQPVHCELHVAPSVQDDGSHSWLVVFEDITERLRHAEVLRHQATHDDLTGLPNRTAVNELLAGLLAGDTSDQVAVLFCDLDNFKRINDSLGHDAGDELLVSLARRLESRLPDGCTAARLSGDEYLVICSDVDAVGGIVSLTTTVSALLRTAVPVHGQPVRVSASIGAAVPTEPRTSAADLLRFADTAMFHAKSRGPDRISLASPALIASADSQMQLEGQLREAIYHDDLALHYQPIVAPDGTILAAEALVRWPHQERGLLTPDVFLPVAAQSDMLRELDRWVLRTALKEAASWPRHQGSQAGIAVNLSGLVPGDPTFVDEIGDIITECGIEWDRVILELVETSLVDLPSKPRQAMSELAERGVRFAVDDFGTGYSSLARLKDLPAQIIKVDRRFVAGVGSDPSDLAVAHAIVDMARAMGRDCIAEGVETATQYHVLRGIGMDSYQGWYFSYPIPPEELRRTFAHSPLPV